jgi:hypothetical protein
VFEKISSAAERLAGSVGASRRGFLARVGQAALGVAAAFGGLLALPTEAQAAIRSPKRYCEVDVGYGSTTMTGYCVCSDGCQSVYQPRQCPPGQGGGVRRPIYVCGSPVTYLHHCTCS